MNESFRNEEITKPDHQIPEPENHERAAMILVNMAARTAHAVNKVYCESIGDFSHVKWSKAEQWQRESYAAGVIGIMRNQETTPEQTHSSWVAKKKFDGWVYGEKKDAEKKTHPYMVPYEELPDEQKLKDQLFVAVVRSVLGLL